MPMPTATNAHRDRGARAHHDHAENVAPEVVGAKPVLRIWRLQLCGNVHAA